MNRCVRAVRGECVISHTHTLLSHTAAAVLISPSPPYTPPCLQTLSTPPLCVTPLPLPSPFFSHNSPSEHFAWLSSLLFLKNNAALGTLPLLTLSIHRFLSCCCFFFLSLSLPFRSHFLLHFAFSLSLFVCDSSFSSVPQWSGGGLCEAGFRSINVSLPCSPGPYQGPGIAFPPSLPHTLTCPSHILLRSSVCRSHGHSVFYCVLCCYFT